MNSMIEFLYKWVAQVANNILSLLPTSPFRTFINGWDAPQYLGWLNWFFPISEILTVLTIWLTSVALFYLYSVIMRWVHLIGD